MCLAVKLAVSLWSMLRLRHRPSSYHLKCPTMCWAMSSNRFECHTNRQDRHSHCTLVTTPNSILHRDQRSNARKILMNDYGYSDGSLKTWAHPSPMSIGQPFEWAQFRWPHPISAHIHLRVSHNDLADCKRANKLHDLSFVSSLIDAIALFTNQEERKIEYKEKCLTNHLII